MVRSNCSAVTRMFEGCLVSVALISRFAEHFQPLLNPLEPAGDHHPYHEKNIAKKKSLISFSERQLLLQYTFHCISVKRGQEGEVYFIFLGKRHKS